MTLDPTPKSSRGGARPNSGRYSLYLCDAEVVKGSLPKRYHQEFKKILKLVDTLIAFGTTPEDVQAHLTGLLKQKRKQAQIELKAND